MAVSGVGAAGDAGDFVITSTVVTKSTSPIDLESLHLATELATAAARSYTPAAMTVTIGNPVAADATYEKPVSVSTEKLVWETPATDSTSQLMGQINTASSSSLLSALGGALLNRIATTQGDFQMSWMRRK